MDGTNHNLSAVLQSAFSFSPFVFLQLMKWGRKILGERGFKWLMKKTVYGQFIAGENRAGIQPVLDHYRKHGVRSILDYAVEEDISEETVIQSMG